MKAAGWAWLPALAWAVALFVLSSFPGHAYPSMPFLSADKLVHAGVYAVMGVLCARAAARTWPLQPAGVALVGGALGALYGVTDELHQLFVPGRSSDWRDAVADGIGAVAGACLVAARLRGAIRGSASLGPRS